MAEIQGRAKGLKPQKKLLVISGIIFIAWIGVLIWMYVSWVWPTRRGGTPTTVERTE